MRGAAVRLVVTLALLPTMLLLGACGSFQAPSLEDFRPPSPDTMFRRQSFGSFAERQLKPVAAEDLVDAEGRCAGAFEVPAEPGAATADGTASVPLIPVAIALDMTECDVVKRAGPPEQVQIGSNERNERTAVLTYIRGERPGIYQFTAGRLTSMERAPAPPPEPKPQRRRPAQKRTSAR